MFVILAERNRARVAAHYQAAALARAMGNDVEMPDMAEADEQFVTSLAEEPKQMDDRSHTLLVALGLR